jgi:hypothetical protein
MLEFDGRVRVETPRGCREAFIEILAVLVRHEIAGSK